LQYTTSLIGEVVILYALYYNQRNKSEVFEMKTLVLYFKLIGLRVLQGLQKLGVLGLGLVGIVTIWNVISHYSKTGAVPTILEIVTIILCVVGIIVLLTVKGIFEAKLAVINDGINHQRSLQKHKTELKQRNEHRLAEKKFEQENVQAEVDALPTRKFAVEKIKRDDLKELESLVGLESVKHELIKMKATMEYEKRNGGVKRRSVSHMKFLGNPGTGKTTVAKVMASILYDAKVIDKPTYISTSGLDLCGAYQGWTAPTINSLFKQGAGGVIFIDEAYALADSATGSDGTGVAQEAVNSLLTHLENQDSKTVVIFGGYEQPMNRFFNMNPGLRSRVPKTLNFPDYTPEELYKILEINVNKQGHSLDVSIKPVMLQLFQEKIMCCNRNNLPFSNGRYARNVADELHSQHAIRFMSDSSIGRTLTREDVVFETLFKLD